MIYLTDHDLAERFGNARPGRQLIAIEDAALPVTALRVLVTAQEEKPLPLLEEFILRSVYSGITNTIAIADFLGLSSEQLEDAIVSQVQNGNLIYEVQNEQVKLAAQGRIAAVELMAIRPVEQEIPACFDRSIWRVTEYRENDLVTKKGATEHGMLLIPASQTSRIDVEDLKLPDLEQLVSKGRGRRRRLQLLSLLRSRVVKHRYLPVKLLLFCDEVQDEPEILIVVNGDESFLHQQALVESGGGSALGMKLNRVSGKERLVFEGRANVECDKITTFEHLRYLRVALAESTSRVVIISPQMRRSVVNSQFLVDLEQRLKKGVSVTIGFGPSDDLSGSSRIAETKLQELTRRYSNFHLLSIEDASTRVLLFDDTYIVSEFDWLSFRGDVARSYKVCEGLVVQGAEAANQVYEAYRTTS
ncbi:hypothetical protein ACR5KS_01960 [Leucobacter sp. W1153]|uniref:hypothetical protein n=1 Tax=Leucobacter sp. W1153 TaxID=3439064 RepID=UPI003F3DB18A